jgi:hypothetical protein
MGVDHGINRQTRPTAYHLLKLKYVVVGHGCATAQPFSLTS